MATVLYGLRLYDVITYGSYTLANKRSRAYNAAHPEAAAANIARQAVRKMSKGSFVAAALVPSACDHKTERYLEIFSRSFLVVKVLVGEVPRIPAGEELLSNTRKLRVQVYLLENLDKPSSKLVPWTSGRSRKWTMHLALANIICLIGVTKAGGVSNQLRNKLNSQQQQS